MKETVRQCRVCLGKHPKATLLRVVKTPEGHIHFDLKQKTNGRGVYFCSDSSCIQKAQKRDLITQAFQIKSPSEIYIELANQIQNRQSVEALLGFAARSRKLVLGVTAVTQAIKKKHARVVILDKNSQSSTRKKIQKFCRVSKTPLFVYYHKPLEKVIGKANCKCIAVKDSGFSKSIQQEMTLHKQD